MRKPPQKCPKNPPTAVVDDPLTPPWAAPWITTPSDIDIDEEDLDDNPRDEPWQRPTAREVLAALAGGALAGLTVYAAHRLATKRSEPPSKASETPLPRRERAGKATSRGGRRKPSGASRAATGTRSTKARTMSDWLNEAMRFEEAVRRARAAAHEAQRSASAAEPSPECDDEAEDRAAAALLGVCVDAGADEIGKAWRRLVRQKMQAGAFHDQPGADRAEAARLISAKNRLLERARLRGGRGGLS